MFTFHYLDTVKRVLRENCTEVSGTTRKSLAEILAEDFPDFSVSDHVLALTILVPAQIPGYHNKVGRGGGIVADSTAPAVTEPFPVLPLQPEVATNVED